MNVRSSSHRMEAQLADPKNNGTAKDECLPCHQERYVVQVAGLCHSILFTDEMFIITMFKHVIKKTVSNSTINPLEKI